MVLQNEQEPSISMDTSGKNVTSKIDIPVTKPRANSLDHQNMCLVETRRPNIAQYLMR
jgi:hypothetical protein